MDTSDIVCLVVNGIIVLAAIVHHIFWIKTEPKNALGLDLILIGHVIVAAAANGIAPFLQNAFYLERGEAFLIALIIVIAYLVGCYFYYRRYKNNYDE